jgi:hypothetical protein
LELGHRNIPRFLATNIPAAVKAGHLIIDMPLIVYPHGNIAVQGLGKKNAKFFFLGIDGKRTPNQGVIF